MARSVKVQVNCRGRHRPGAAQLARRVDLLSSGGGGISDVNLCTPIPLARSRMAIKRSDSTSCSPYSYLAFCRAFDPLCRKYVLMQRLLQTCRFAHAPQRLADQPWQHYLAAQPQHVVRTAMYSWIWLWCFKVGCRNTMVCQGGCTSCNWMYCPLDGDDESPSIGSKCAQAMACACVLRNAVPTWPGTRT